MLSPNRAVPALALVLLPLATPAAGQTVQDVVDQMYDALAEYSEGVDNYTLVQTVSGFETQTYFEKEVVDGRPIFVVKETSSGGQMMRGDDMTYTDISAFADDLVEHGRYAGRENIDGHDVHVIAIDDLTQLDFAAPAGPDDMQFVAKSGTIAIDTEQLIPRRMIFVGEATTANGTHEVTTTVDLRDYREVQGLRIPYVSAIQIEGIDAMVDPEMRAQYEEMKRQLESLPEDQRAMFERMMGSQMEQIEQMMAGDGGPMTMEVLVTDVRVNEGPPGQ